MAFLLLGEHMLHTLCCLLKRIGILPTESVGDTSDRSIQVPRDLMTNHFVIFWKLAENYIRGFAIFCKVSHKQRR